jgi:alkanesulfonate monooxygenase SsuD/methylene tetrahydromethanopterin reductase-like flavin-dependent oxidoreductase (luciferase family)
VEGMDDAERPIRIGSVDNAERPVQIGGVDNAERPIRMGGVDDAERPIRTGAVDGPEHPIRPSATLPFGGPTTRGSGAGLPLPGSGAGLHSAGSGAGLPSLAVTLPQFSAEAGPALEACRDARRLGFGGVFVFDHMWPLGAPTRPALEGWTLLAALAAEVGRQPEGSGEPQGGAPVGRGGGFRVGTMVTRAGIRAPALVARMAATVGEVAGDPPIVGVGRGDRANRDENLAFGLPFGSAAERAAAVEDTVAALRGPVAGKPAPEVWVGGVGPGARELAGRLADAWNAWALDPDELAAGLADARAAAERAGRDPGSIAATWGGQVLVAPDRADARARLERFSPGRPPAELARVVTGDPDRVLERLRALGDAGASWCVLALVGGPGAEARALLAAAADLTGREA